MKEDDKVNHVSNLTEATITIKTDAPAGTGYQLVVRNAAGVSKAFKVEIVQ